MKNKWLIIFILVIIILVFISVFFSEKEDKFITELTYSQLVTKNDKKEKFILYVKSTDCSACKEFSPDLITVLREHKLKAYSLYTDKLSDKDKELYNDFLNVDGTPTVLFFENGQASMNKIEGSKSSKNKEIIIKKLTNAGYIESEE